MKKKVIAIIPARSGSKSIKDKNIAKVKDKPLIAWSISAAKKCKYIDEFYISTDSPKYAKIAKRYGAKNIIIRPLMISKDKSQDIEFVQHAIKNIDEDFEIIVHLRPTTPFRKIKDLNAAIVFFKKNKIFSSLRSVHEEAETSYKSFEIKKKKLYPLNNIGKSIDQLNRARQSFPKTYVANGAFDLYRKSYILKNHKLFGKQVMAFKTDFHVEIDTKEQLKYIKNIHAKNTHKK